jgi:propionyl-CoA carboxylase alpha chain
LLPLLVHLPKASDSDDAQALLSPMPGLLVSLDVSVGDQVVPGQALARLEAMKMENLLRATQAARVTQILVSPGDSLSLGDVIMEFEPLDEAES